MNTIIKVSIFPLLTLPEVKQKKTSAKKPKNYKLQKVTKQDKYLLPILIHQHRKYKQQK